jgi:dihydroxy-acid dehydratase
VKVSAVPKNLWLFEGPARVYEDEESAIREIKAINKGEVVVLRGLGPKGGPGTVFACSFVAAANGTGIAPHIAVVTDGELSGLNRGLVVGQVMPEAAEGGPLAVVQDGDIITIDLYKAEITLHAKDLDQRLKSWKPKPVPGKRSWLTFYAKLVQPIYNGAVLG